MRNDFYVYAWYDIDTNEVFYIGKGCGDRYKKITGRNKLFLDYIASHNVDVQILKDGLEEAEAFYYEKMFVDDYKTQGQCSCNLAEAGKGGCHFVWTEEFKEYWSENNPMKSEEQRKRMSENNPMYNKDIAMKNGAAHKRAIFIGDQQFDGIVDAAKCYERSATTIGDWLRRGTTPQGLVCGYIGEAPMRKSGRGKPVIVDGIYYPSITEACRVLHIAPNNLRKAIEQNRTCKGHTCEYANQQPSQ